MGKLHSAQRCFPRRQRVLDHTLGIPYGQLIDRSFLAAIIRNWSTLATGARHFLDEATGYSFSDKEGLPTPTELSHERILYRALRSPSAFGEGVNKAGGSPLAC